MEYKFPRKLRLTTDNQFKLVFRKGRKISSKPSAVFYHNNKLAHPRLGVIAPKKSIRKAKDRNYFKRLIREGFRLRQHELGSIDIVILAYRDVEYVSEEEFCKCLQKQWEDLILRQKKL